MPKHHFEFLVAVTFLITAVVGEAEWHRATDDTYYLIDPDAKVNWYAAVGSCGSRNLSLVTSVSEERYMALRDVLRVVANATDFWIGGVYSSVTDDVQYDWAATGNQFNYTYWAEDDSSDDAAYMQCVYIKAYDFLRVRNDCDDNNFGLLCENKYDNGLQALETQLKDVKRRIDNLLGSILAKLKKNIALLN